MFQVLKRKRPTEIERVAVEIWTDGKRVEELLPSWDIPPDSRPWNADGKLIHSLEKVTNETNLETKYRPVAIEIFDEKLNITPDDLHDALKWTELQRMLRPKPSLLEKINAGLTIALLAILCLFTFLIFSNLVTAE